MDWILLYSTFQLQIIIQLYHDTQHATLSSSTNLCKILKTIIFNIKTIKLSENKRLFPITVFNIKLSYNSEICELLKFQIYHFKKTVTIYQSKHYSL